MMKFPFLLLWGALVLGASSAQAAPLSSILQSMGTGEWSAVVTEAKRQAENDRPAFLSAPATTPFYETFEGTWTAPSNGTRLAIFSDDGCDVWVDGQKVVSLKGSGQALPNLSQSLIPIAFDFKKDKTYSIKVEYSNTFYVGAADIDGVTLFSYADSQRTWSDFDAGGGKIGQSRNAEGAWGDDGRLTSPVDTRGGQTQSVKCGPGGRLSFSAETASDWDAWQDKRPGGEVVASDYWQDEVVRATWKCDAGKFVVTGTDGKETMVDSVEGQRATWVAWGTSTGEHKVWIEFDDEGSAPPTPDKGERDDEVLKREQTVDVVKAELLVRRMKSPEESTENDWDDSAIVAAGGADSPEQKANVKIDYNGSPIALPVGTVSMDVQEAVGEEGVNAQLAMQGSTGTFTSHNLVEALVHLRIDAGPNSPEAKIYQYWGDQFDMNVADTFEYGQKRPISFTPFVGDGSRTSIKKQNIKFAPNKITFYAWDKSSNDYKAYIFDTKNAKWNKVSPLVEFSPALVNNTSGTYATQFSIKYDKKHLVDIVEFSAIGESVREQ